MQAHRLAHRLSQKINSFPNHQQTPEDLLKIIRAQVGRVRGGGGEGGEGGGVGEVRGRGEEGVLQRRTVLEYPRLMLCLSQVLLEGSPPAQVCIT
jgi:hypothetical protein